MKTITRLASVLLAALAGTVPLHAQEPAADFAEAIDVRVVNVDVLVTDAAGRPVRGLRARDFRLFEDGRPVEITNFFEAGESIPAPAAATEPGAAAPEAASPAHPRTPVDPATLVLYFDNTTMLAPHRNRVLEDLRGMVAPADPARSYLVVAFNPGLEILTPLTDDPETVLAALDRVAGMPASGLQALQDRNSVRRHVRDMWKDVEESKGAGLGVPGVKRNSPSAARQGTRGRFFDPCEETWGNLVAAVDAYAAQQMGRVTSAQGGLTDLTRLLGGMPGRKVVLYLSDGLEQMPGRGEYELLAELCPDRAQEVFGLSARFDQTRTLQELAAVANAHRVTYYALDTAGMAPLGASSAEFDDPRFTPSLRTDMAQRDNRRNSLFLMAEETGGRAFFDANRPAAELSTMTTDLSNYYSLGFSPDHGWDGKIHRLKLKLDKRAGQGLTVRYRTGYRAVPHSERIVERTFSSLVLGMERNPLGIAARFGAPTALEDGGFRVPLEILVPLAALTAVSDEEVGRCSLRVVLVVPGRGGAGSQVRERVVPLEVPLGGPAAGSRHRLVVQLRLDAGSHQVAVGIEDRHGGGASFVRAEIEVG